MWHSILVCSLDGRYLEAEMLRIIIEILFVTVFTGTGLSVILFIKALPEMKMIWKDVKHG